MNRTIEIEFAEESAVEIPATTTQHRNVKAWAGGRRQFWIGWQLFGTE